MATHKLTPKMLKQIILEEASKLDADKKVHEKELVDLANKTKEVDADGFADTLEKEVNFMATLKIKEAKIIKALRQIREARAKSKERLSKLRS